MEYQCDVCGEMKDEKEIQTIQVYGTDTDACKECREG